MEKIFKKAIKLITLLTAYTNQIMRIDRQEDSYFLKNEIYPWQNQKFSINEKWVLHTESRKMQILKKNEDFNKTSYSVESNFQMKYFIRNNLEVKEIELFKTESKVFEDDTVLIILTKNSKLIFADYSISGMSVYDTLELKTEEIDIGKKYTKIFKFEEKKEIVIQIEKNLFKIDVENRKILKESNLGETSLSLYIFKKDCLINDDGYYLKMLSSDTFEQISEFKIEIPGYKLKSVIDYGRQSKKCDGLLLTLWFYTITEEFAKPVSIFNTKNGKMEEINSFYFKEKDMRNSFFLSFFPIQETTFVIMQSAIGILALVNPYDNMSKEKEAQLELITSVKYSDLGSTFIGIENPIITGKQSKPQSFTFLSISMTPGISKVPSLSRVSLCGGIGCQECTEDFKDCLKCKEGYVELKDKIYEDKICINSCPSDVERISLKRGECINCLRNSDLDPEACYFSVVFGVKLATLSLRDEYSSLSYVFTFKDSFKILGEISRDLGKSGKVVKWEDFVKVEFEDLEEKYAKKRFILRNDQLVLDVNFTKNVENIYIKFSTIEPKVIYRNEESQKILLIFGKTDQKLKIKGAKSEKTLSKIHNFKAIIEALDSSISILVIFSITIALLSITFQLPTLPYIIKYIFFFKMVGYLKYININFGFILLNSMFNNLKNRFIFESSTGVNMEILEYSGVNSRGKITQYHFSALTYFENKEIYIGYLVKNNYLIFL